MVFVLQKNDQARVAYNQVNITARPMTLYRLLSVVQSLTTLGIAVENHQSFWVNQEGSACTAFSETAVFAIPQILQEIYKIVSYPVVKIG